MVKKLLRMTIIAFAPATEFWYEGPRQSNHYTQCAVKNTTFMESFKVIQTLFLSRLSASKSTPRPQIWNTHLNGKRRQQGEKMKNLVKLRTWEKRASEPDLCFQLGPSKKPQQRNGYNYKQYALQSKGECV